MTKKYIKDWLIAEWNNNVNVYEIYIESEEVITRYWTLPKEYVEEYWEEIKEETIIDKIIDEIFPENPYYIDKKDKEDVKQILQKYLNDDWKEELLGSLKTQVTSKVITVEKEPWFLYYTWNNILVETVELKDLKKELDNYYLIKKQ